MRWRYCVSVAWSVLLLEVGGRRERSVLCCHVQAGVLESSAATGRLESLTC